MTRRTQGKSEGEHYPLLFREPGAHVFPALGFHPIGTISRGGCRELIADTHAKGLKTNTVKGIARTLSSVPAQAVDDERLAANPALRMGRYLRCGDEPKAQIEPLTRDEAGRLVATAQRQFPRWHPWILLALRTGLRLGEQLAVQADIDWNGRFLAVQRNQPRGVITTPTSHQRRRVDMSAQLAATLLVWRHQRELVLKKGREVPAWVFPSLDGTALEERNVRHVFNDCFRRPGSVTSAFMISVILSRRCCCSRASPVYVKEQLGHSSIQITVDTYGHLIPGANRAAVDRLDDPETQPGAIPAQPEPSDEAETVSESMLLLGKSGEPLARRALLAQSRELRKKIAAAPKRSAERRALWAEIEELRKKWRPTRSTLLVTEPKSTRSRRTVRLPGVVVTALKTHRTRQLKERLAAGKAWEDRGFVFTSPLGTPLDPRNVTREFKALLVAAKLPNVRFHDLRHTAATLLLAQGVDPRTIMETLGHSQISLTMNTYSHVLPALQEDAAAKLDAALSV